MRMKPQPTLDMTYSMVLMEEHKRSNINTEPNNTTLVARQPIKKDHYNNNKKEKMKHKGRNGT